MLVIRRRRSHPLTVCVLEVGVPPRRPLGHGRASLLPIVFPMEDPGSSSPARKLFFPLRSAVELFVDPRSPDVVTKAKEAAILYDEVTFEVGMLDVSITPNGSTSFWNPPEAMTPELLDRSRRIDAVGSPMTLAIGRQDEAGVPAEEMHVFVEGQVSHRFLAEFHTGILDDLAPFEPDWVRTIDTGAAYATVGREVCRVQPRRADLRGDPPTEFR